MRIEKTYRQLEKTEEVHIYDIKEDEDRYYKLLFQRAFCDKSIKPEKGFSYIKLVNLIKDMTNQDKPLRSSDT